MRYELLFYMHIMQRYQIVYSVYVLGYGLSDSGFESWQGKYTFLSSKMSRRILRSTKPHIKRVREFFPGGKEEGV